jgi:hypothetical protein
MGKVKSKVIEAEERLGVTPDDMQYMDAEELRELIAIEDEGENK